MLATLILTLGITREPYPTISDTWVYHQWEYMGSEYTYELQFSKENDYSKPPARSWAPVSDPVDYTLGQLVYIQENGLICRRVKYYKEDSTSYKELGCFYQRGNEPQVPNPIPEEKETLRYSLPQNLDLREEIQSQETDTSVLGVTKEEKNEECNISILLPYSRVTDFNCDLGIKIKDITNTQYNNTYTVSTYGEYKAKILADISIYECAKFNIFQPKTWFKCNPILKKEFQKDLDLIYTLKLSSQNTSSKPNFAFNTSTFFLQNTFLEDISGKREYLLTQIYSQFRDEYWIDIEYSKKIEIAIPQAKKEDSDKEIFTYPLDRLIGVTQWHGCTQYQCPHKGIDFGARLNNVLAIGDGIVVETGWDSYGSECNQGGRYLVIKHINGMHSIYFHLNSYLVNTGDTVRKNQQIGISGNSGKWNCQNLGYHLHFELRNQRVSSTHIDPVPYISVDWNLVKTIGKDIYPKRLSGDNPHPTF